MPARDHQPVTRPLIVGQAPSKGMGGTLARGGAARLARLLDLRELADAFDVVNLLPTFPGKAGKGDLFPPREAHAAAVMLERFAPHESIVLLGHGVCRAFMLDLAPLESVATRGRRWFHVPHPSGVNLWWNDAEHAAAARALLLALVPLRCG